MGAGYHLRPFAAMVAISMVAIAFVQYSDFRVAKKITTQLKFAVMVTILVSSFCFSRAILKDSNPIKVCSHGYYFSIHQQQQWQHQRWHRGIVAMGGGNSDGCCLDSMAAAMTAMAPKKSAEKSGEMVAEMAEEMLQRWCRDGGSNGTVTAAVTAAVMAAATVAAMASAATAEAMAAVLFALGLKFK